MLWCAGVMALSSAIIVWGAMSKDSVRMKRAMLVSLVLMVGAVVAFLVIR